MAVIGRSRVVIVTVLLLLLRLHSVQVTVEAVVHVGGHSDRRDASVCGILCRFPFGDIAARNSRRADAEVGAWCRRRCAKVSVRWRRRCAKVGVRWWRRCAKDGRGVVLSGDLGQSILRPLRRRPEKEGDKSRDTIT